MTGTYLMKIILISAAALLSVAGQVLIKMAVSGIPGSAEMGAVKLLTAVIWQPMAFIGLALYGISMVLFIKLLAVAELSYVGLGLSLGIVFLVLGSRIFLGEPVTMFKAAGCALIVAGIVVIHWH